MSASTFELYRYQILPINRFFQADLYDGFRSLEDLLTAKNAIFMDALRRLDGSADSARPPHVRVEAAELDWASLVVAPSRRVQRETLDFRKEQFEHWPWVKVFVLNREDEQLLVIQKRSAAYQDTRSVVRLLLKRVSAYLEARNLRVHVEPLFEEQYFWALVSDYESRLKKIRFELVTPNMANISGALPDDLKNLSKRMNAAKSEVALEADDDSVLSVSRDDPVIGGLVDYASKGGGDVVVKVMGLRQELRTSKTRNAISVDELSLSGPAASVIKIIRSLVS